MTTALPKYALLEIERRMLVDATLLPSLEPVPFVSITDRYLDGGRLRLRKMVASDGTTQFKLCKKYGHTSAYVEPITNLYLTQAEYEVLTSLPGNTLYKRRYRYTFDGHTFGLDQFEGELTGLYLCEKEAPSVEELAAIIFPPFCVEDVTADPAYSGAALAARSRKL